MGAELGRISGPLLSANLLRDGIDLAFDTDLLYFDVVNGRIGINTDSPTRTLTVSGTTSTPDLISDTSLTVDNFAVLSNRIQHYAGEIYVQPNQTLDPTILITTVETDDLRINTQLIKNFTADDSIEISTNGTGLVNFYTDKINITGNLHATGNITWDGNIIFGNNSNDSVTFNSDITSNIIPNVTNTYDLGTELKQWNTLFANEIVADSLEFNDIVVDGINLTLLTGNTIYVSVNGNNNNLGTHFSNPVRTLKYALSVASPGDEIIIYSGDYEEEFPLTVPQGVSVKGAGIRAVSIRPTTSTNTADAFLLNGETTVSELTVKGFNAPGYAFKLAPNTIVSSRSPYVQYVTVITDGAQAGNGALVDGSVVNTTSREASMLFNAVTMIVPNAIGVSATNGARIEWLNSFTYFADKGIYLTEGTLGFASEATRFGAEMRSIGSANVYGNYGAVADGEHTLAYLIGHNFGYIGSGTNSFNERGLVIQGNEVVELNDGNIYFDSMDHKGDYRVGDIFYVNQETGVVSFDAQSIDFGAQGNITLEGPNGSVILNKDFVQSGNIRFYDNTISSLSGPVNISSFSSVTTLNTDVNVETDLTITGNFNIDGTVITFGNQLSDIVTIADLLTQTIKPNVTSTYTLGTNTVGDPRIWNSIYLSLLDVDGVTQLDNSTISILTADTNLVLDAAGTGKIIVAETDVDISNNLTVVNGLTVSGISSIKNTLTTDIIQSGNFNQTGNSDITGNLESNNILITDPLSYLQLPGILISSADSITGKISGRSTDTDVSISTAGSGRIYIPSNNVRIDNDLSVGGTLTISGVSELTSVDLEDITLVGEYTLTGNFSTSGTIDSGSITTTAGSILTLPRVTINNSSILGTYPDTDLEIVAAGTGRIYILDNDVRIDNNLLVSGALTVDNTTSLFDDLIAGNITLTGNYDQTGNTFIDGDLQAESLIINNGYLDVGDFRIQNQTIAGKISDSDVLYTADGTGFVKVGPTIYFDGSEIGTTAAQSFISETNEIFIAENGEEFISEGAGADVDIQITPDDSNLIINSLAFLTLPSSTAASHTLTTAGELRFDPTSSTYSPGVYGLEGYAVTGSQWLMNVFSSDRQTGIFESNNTINFFTTDETIRSYIDETGWYTTTSLELGNFNIVGTTISNKSASTDSSLAVSGTGSVLFNNIKLDTNDFYTPNNSPLVLSNTGVGYVKFNGTTGVQFGVGSDLDRPATPESGTIRYNTDLGYSEVYDTSAGWIPLSGQPLSEDDFTDVNNLWALILG